MMRKRKIIEISLPYNSPLDWQSLIAFFRFHQIIGIETISEMSYGRVFKIGNTFNSLNVTHHKKEALLILQVFTDHQTIIPWVVTKIRKMFDLDVNLSAFADKFSNHELFNVLWMRYPGLRLASGWDPFETAINTILGQMVSVSRAKDLMRELVERHGEKIVHPVTGEDSRLFPSPKILAEADLTHLGTTRIRKKTIREFSWLVAQKQIDLTTQDINRLKKKLLSIAGIGPWSVEYIALRAFGDTDSFPGTDLILKRAVEKYPDINLEDFRPWRSYVAVYLWKHYTKLQS